MNSGLGGGLAALQQPQQPPPSPLAGGYSGGGSAPFAGGGLSSPGANGSLHGGYGAPPCSTVAGVAAAARPAGLAAMSCPLRTGVFGPQTLGRRPAGVAGGPRATAQVDAAQHSGCVQEDGYMFIFGLALKHWG
jgi:hypothetical protein